MPAPRRLPSSSLSTPSSSTRESLDAARSRSDSPILYGAPAAATAAGARDDRRASRTALREYYNLPKAGAGSGGTVALALLPSDRSPLTGPLPLPSPDGQTSEMDTVGFDAGRFVARTLTDCGLEELLRVYTRVLGEVRALDAEKKALVYDNYSKLISATETIRKMMANMDPLSPLASTLDPAIAHIYSQAQDIRQKLRQTIPSRPEADSGPAGDGSAAERQSATRRLARIAVRMPDRLRKLVHEDKVAQARVEWKLPRRMLEIWRDQQLGGDEVEALILEGDSIIA